MGVPGDLPVINRLVLGYLNSHALLVEDWNEKKLDFPGKWVRREPVCLPLDPSLKRYMHMK